MAVAIGLWSCVVKPGKKQTIVAQTDIHITNATLGADLASNDGRTTVKLTHASLPIGADDEDEDEGETTVTVALCSLTPGKIEQATFDIILEEGEEYTFAVSGKNEVHLAGNHIDQIGPDQAPFDSDDEESDEEDAYNLQDVSSDVEVDIAELDELDAEADSGRFEEIAEQPSPKSNKKRARGSDAMDTTAGEAAAEPVLSKSQKKQLSKKLKAANGDAVPTGESVSAVSVENASAGDKSDSKTAQQAKKSKPGQKETKYIEMEGGLQIWDSTVGTGKMAKKGTQVNMRYIGKLSSDGTIFDKNTKGKPFSFKLGAGEVIKGWDQGIVGMQPGGERVIIIPPGLGYGKRKMADIPPNSTLRFEVKCLEVK